MKCEKRVKYVYQRLVLHILDAAVTNSLKDRWEPRSIAKHSEAFLWAAKDTFVEDMPRQKRLMKIARGKRRMCGLYKQAEQ